MAPGRNSSDDCSAGTPEFGKRLGRAVVLPNSAPRGARISFSLSTTITTAALLSALALTFGPALVVGPAGASSSGDRVLAEGGALDPLRANFLPGVSGGQAGAAAAGSAAQAGSPTDVTLPDPTMQLEPGPQPSGPSIIGVLDPSAPVGETGDLGIPLLVLQAYHRAAERLAATQPRCRLPWWLLAGIGHTESGHAEGGRLYADGTTRGRILGPRLDGGIAGDAVITDTDGGRLDGDTIYDRAVGPMQFIPSTWANWASDGNGDGRSDPNNIFDATLAAGRYLCAGGRDLSTQAGITSAVLSYNYSQAYLSTVLTWGTGYRDGATPQPISTAPIVSDVITVRPPVTSRPVTHPATSPAAPNTSAPSTTAPTTSPPTTSPAATASPSSSASAPATPALTETATPSGSPSTTLSPTGADTTTASDSPTPTPSDTSSEVLSCTPSPVPTPADPGPSVTGSSAATSGATPSASPTVSASADGSVSPSASTSASPSSTAPQASSGPTPSPSLSRCTR
jgi:membrane-bound lytic murein transglycosylase B